MSYAYDRIKRPLFEASNFTAVMRTRTDVMFMRPLNLTRRFYDNQEIPAVRAARGHFAMQVLCLNGLDMWTLATGSLIEGYSRRFGASERCVSELGTLLTATPRLATGRKSK